MGLLESFLLVPMPVHSIDCSRTDIPSSSCSAAESS